MTRSLLLVSLTAGALAVPMPASSAATEIAIRQINVRPAAPVVGAANSIRLVIDVVAKGVRVRDGVSVKVEPGAPPGPVIGPSPEPSPPASPAPRPASPPPSDDSGEESWDEWDEWDWDDRPSSDAEGSLSDTRAEPRTKRSAKPSSKRPVRPRAESEPSTREEAPGTGDGQRPPAERVETDPGRTGTDTGQAERNQAGTGSGEAVPGVQTAVRREASPLAGSPGPSSTRMGGGWQTWRFLPDKTLNRYYPAGTWTVTATARGADGTEVTAYASFQLKRESRLGGVRVTSAGDGVRLSGSLNRVDPRGRTDYAPFARQRVDIYWRQDASATWQRVSEATTTAQGTFQRAVSGRAGGDWRVRYPGTGHYAPDSSRIRQMAQYCNKSLLMVIKAMLSETSLLNRDRASRNFF